MAQQRLSSPIGRIGKIARTDYKAVIADYYSRRETRWGYKYLLGGNKHYGYYPAGARLGIKKAQRLMNKQVGKELGLPRDALVLDAGCGEGLVAISIAKDFDYRVVGIDLLDINIEIANKNKSKSKEQNVSFRQMDFSKTDFPDNHFDGVYILEALVHSPDYKKTLKEFYRILKPGGVLVNHDYVLPEKMTADEEHAFKVIYDGSGMNTLDDFRYKSMKKSWESVGFENVTIYNGIKEITPMMRSLHRLAYIPFQILRLFGKEEYYVNTYAGVKVYELRHLIHYNMMRSYKPRV